MTGQFYAGFAKAKVTPPMGINIPGYFRRRFAQGVVSDLYLCAVAISDGENKAIIFSCDALGIRTNAYHIISQKVAARCGISPEAVYIHATHSHTSFKICVPEEQLDDCDIFLHRLYQQFCDVAQFAFEDLKPVTDVRNAKGEAKDVGFIRRYRMKDGTCKTNPGIGHPDILKFDAEQDNSVQLVRLQREDAKEILIINFGTHPDVVGGNKYSADWPGFVRDYVVGAFGGDVEALFLNGCQGDSNHINAFKHNGVHEKGVPHDVSIAKRMARVISGEVLKIYDDATSVPFDKVGFGSTVVKVGKNPYDPADVPMAQEINDLYYKLNTGKDPIFKKYKMSVPEALRIIRNLSAPEYFELLISSVQLGNIAFIGFPGEAFCDIGIQVKKCSKMDMTICTCCTNGSEGYFPTAAAFAEKGYERSTSPFAHNVAQLLTDGAMELIERMEKLPKQSENK